MSGTLHSCAERHRTVEQSAALKLMMPNQPPAFCLALRKSEQEIKHRCQHRSRDAGVDQTCRIALHLDAETG